MSAEDYFDFDAIPEESDDSPRGYRKWSKPTMPMPNPMPKWPCPKHGMPWSLTDEQALRGMANSRTAYTVEEMARVLGRTAMAITCQIERMKDEGVPLPDIIPATSTNPMKETSVKMTHLLTLLQEGYTTVLVSLDSETGRGYTYKAPLDMELKPLDRVVVYANDKLKVGLITKVDEEPQIDFDRPYALKWVVQKVDLTVYDEHTVREAAVLAQLTKADRSRKREAALRELLGTPEELAVLRMTLNSK